MKKVTILMMISMWFGIDSIAMYKPNLRAMQRRRVQAMHRRRCHAIQRRRQEAIERHDIQGALEQARQCLLARQELKKHLEQL